MLSIVHVAYYSNSYSLSGVLRETIVTPIDRAQTDGYMHENLDLASTQ